MIKRSYCLLVIMSVTFVYGGTGNEYSLNRCKDLAIKNNVDIKNASLQVEASKQMSKSVITKFFPKADAQVVTFRTKDPLLDMKIPSMNLPVYDGNPANLAAPTQFTYIPDMPISALERGTIGTVSVAVPVYTGGRLVNGYKLAKLGEEVNREKLHMAENSVLLGTEERYWRVITLYDKLKTVDLYNSLLDTLYKEANAALSAGLINRNDLLKIAIKQSEIGSNRLQLENGIKLSTMEFCQYIGIPYDSSISFSDSIVDCPPLAEIYTDPKDAVLKRHEYVLLQKAVLAEKLQTRLKTGEYLPEIGIGGGDLYLKDLGKDGSNGFITATVKVPITDWWEANYTIRERKIKEKITEQESKNNSELLELQIEKAWNELNEQYKQIEYAESILKQASENLKINSDNYKAGLVNISDMLETQTMYKKGKDDLLDTKVGYRLKLVSYKQLTCRQ